MKLNYTNGNIFNTSKDTLKIQCISADLAMGAGIALQFNQEYDIKNKLRTRFTDRQSIGQYIKTKGFCIFERPVFNLVTKEHFYDKPTYETLQNALENMREQLEFLLIDTEYTKENPLQIVCPEIGCGLDRLDVNKVQGLLLKIFFDLPIQITMYHFDKSIQFSTLKQQNKTQCFDMNEANQYANKIFKLLIAGSRTFAMADKNVERHVEDTVLRLLSKKQADGYDIEIVQGGAAGADNWGHRFALEHNYKEKVISANWEQYGKKAGILRNKEMFDYITKDNGECGCILLWDGESRGTNHDIQLAKKYNVQTKVMLFDSRYPEIETCNWMGLSKLSEYSSKNTLNLIHTSNELEYDLE